MIVRSAIAIDDALCGIIAHSTSAQYVTGTRICIGFVVQDDIATPCRGKDAFENIDGMQEASTRIFALLECKLWFRQAERIELG